MALKERKTAQLSKFKGGVGRGYITAAIVEKQDIEGLVALNSPLKARVVILKARLNKVDKMQLQLLKVMVKILLQIKLVMRAKVAVLKLMSSKEQDWVWEGLSCLLEET